MDIQDNGYMKDLKKSEIRRILFRIKTVEDNLKLKSIEMLLGKSSQEILELSLDFYFQKLLKENPKLSKIQEFVEDTEK